MNTLILAVFIASTSFFEVALPVGTAYEQKTFPNSEEGIELLGRWIEATGVTEFDHVCVGGPSIEVTPVQQFWATRKAPVFFMRFVDLQDFARRHQLPEATATAVAAACTAMATGRR